MHNFEHIQQINLIFLSVNIGHVLVSLAQDKIHKKLKYTLIRQFL